jgi:hypothetical protein
MPPFLIEDWEGYTGHVSVGVTCRSVMVAPLATIVCNEDFVGSKERAYASTSSAKRKKKGRVICFRAAWRSVSVLTV